jgi:hypothetical protein
MVCQQHKLPFMIGVHEFTEDSGCFKFPPWAPEHVHGLREYVTSFRNVCRQVHPMSFCQSHIGSPILAAFSDIPAWQRSHSLHFGKTLSHVLLKEALVCRMPAAKRRPALGYVCEPSRSAVLSTLAPMQTPRPTQPVSHMDSA